MKVVTIVGARPQFVKAAAVSKVLRAKHQEVLVHTGQHYDYKMSGIFFEGLEIPDAEVNLEVGSGTHGAQTGAMLDGIEKVLLREKPDWMLVYGDTNSTLAGALAASKLHIPIAHVEAGLRSFNRQMPEEINRVVTDHISARLFCPSDVAVKNLAAEGVRDNVHIVGDVMLDVLLWAKAKVQQNGSRVLQEQKLNPKKYLLLTLHRAENTDDPRRLAAIIHALNSISEPILFPVHPRARKVIAASGHTLKPHIQMVDPLSYFEMVAAAANARLILTDSGGLQKEAYWLEVPCVTLRDQTEWVETVDIGWNILVGANSEQIVEAAKSSRPPASHPQIYGDGKTAARCIELL